MWRSPECSLSSSRSRIFLAASWRTKKWRVAAHDLQQRLVLAVARGQGLDPEEQLVVGQGQPLLRVLRRERPARASTARVGVASSSPSRCLLIRQRGAQASSSARRRNSSSTALSIARSLSLSFSKVRPKARCPPSPAPTQRTSPGRRGCRRPASRSAPRPRRAEERRRLAAARHPGAVQAQVGEVARRAARLEQHAAARDERLDARRACASPCAAAACPIRDHQTEPLVLERLAARRDRVRSAHDADHAEGPERAADLEVGEARAPCRSPRPPRSPLRLVRSASFSGRRASSSAARPRSRPRAS